jgi:hypothetical protein
LASLESRVNQKKKASASPILIFGGSATALHAFKVSAKMAYS